MTRSLTERHEQNGGGRMAARSADISIFLGGGGRRWPDLKEAHPSCVLPAHTISNAPWKRFALRVKEIKMRFQLFLLSPSTLSWLRKNLSAIYDTDDRNMGLQLHSCVSRACGRKNFSSLESTLLRAEREPECLLSLT